MGSRISEERSYQETRVAGYRDEARPSRPRNLRDFLGTIRESCHEVLSTIRGIRIASRNAAILP
jgi:hypothetical protein